MMFFVSFLVAAWCNEFWVVSGHKYRSFRGGILRARYENWKRSSYYDRKTFFERTEKCQLRFPDHLISVLFSFESRNKLFLSYTFFTAFVYFAKRVLVRHKKRTFLASWRIAWAASKIGAKPLLERETRACRWLFFCVYCSLTCFIQRFVARANDSAVAHTKICSAQLPIFVSSKKWREMKRFILFLSTSFAIRIFVTRIIFHELKNRSRESNSRAEPKITPFPYDCTTRTDKLFAYRRESRGSVR